MEKSEKVEEKSEKVGKKSVEEKDWEKCKNFEESVKTT